MRQDSRQNPKQDRQPKRRNQDTPDKITFATTVCAPVRSGQPLFCQVQSLFVIDETHQNNETKEQDKEYDHEYHLLFHSQFSLVY
jgi:hypothetical protein